MTRKTTLSRALPVVTLAVLAALAVACHSAQPEPAAKPAAETNPLLVEWTTPFGVPPFAAIRPEHFPPALTAGMAAQAKEIAAITGSSQPATFANTLEAFDDSGQLLEKVNAVFGNLTSAETNDALQAIQKEFAPKLAAHRDDIRLNAALFARVKAVWDARATLKLSSEQARLLEETYTDFVRAGALLGPEQKEQMRAINQELAGLGVKFGDNVLKQTNAYRLVLDSKEQLAGLPDRVIAVGADAAKAAGLEGKWVYTLHGPSIWPFLENSSDRGLRKQILDAYLTRGDHGDEYDNNKVIARIAALRVEKAKLLGYPTWADFQLERNMAKNPAGVYGLLDRVWPPALAVARRELADMQAMVDASNGGFKVDAADWRYYAEKVKKARYDLDDAALRPYFQLDKVREGVFYVANRLYGLTFTERPDLPVYNSEVRGFEVKEADGTHVGIIYLDYFPRPGKRGGAWSSTYRRQWVRDGKNVTPVVVNVGNFSRPAGDTPALLSIDEVETMFHEFGHGLHQLLSRCRYKSLS
ncbi:MAG: peptidase, partial [Acidobacteria bacterium]|nr:peptidase [Acidobacteriota bacterium]